MKSYWRKYFLVTFFLALFSVAITRLPFMQPHELFTVLLLIFNALLSPFIFWIASRGITDKNNYRFVNAVMGSMTIKLLLSVIFIMVYAMMAAPGKPYFIIPFFVDYVSYTILEVREMVKLTKLSHPKPQK